MLSGLDMASGQRRSNQPEHRRFSFLTFLSLAILLCSDGDFRKRGWARASATMLSAFHHTLFVFGLSLAVALTAAWDGLLGYGLFRLISTVFSA
jgi:hypothetical protein